MSKSKDAFLFEFYSCGTEGGPSLKNGATEIIERVNELEDRYYIDEDSSSNSTDFE